jgi:hypothetical protein
LFATGLPIGVRIAIFLGRRTLSLNSTWSASSNGSMEKAASRKISPGHARFAIGIKDQTSPESTLKPAMSLAFSTRDAMNGLDMSQPATE